MTNETQTAPAGKVTGEDRRLILGICAVLAAVLVSSATFNYIILPMISDLGASEQQQSLLRQLPSIGALLMIFIAGVLGPHVGPRKFITFCALLMAAGYTAVMLSPAMAVTSAGMLLGSVGLEGVLVVAVGLMASRLTNPDARASGFSTLAIVGPAVYLVAPIAAAALVGELGWRPVIGLWVVAALCAAFLARRQLPPDDAKATGRIELWTPALAGFVLACLVQTINNINRAGFSATKSLVWLAAGALAAVALVVLMRRLAHPSLDISVLRHGGFRLLLVVVLLVPFASMTFYATVGTQFVYGFNEFETSLIMIPAQLASVAGGLLSGVLMRRRGIRFTGSVALFTMSAALFLTTTQTVNQPLWLSLLILCLYSCAVTASNAPLTNSIMNLAAKGAEGSAAAFRGASANLGAAIGVVIMSTLVFGTFQSSLTTQLQNSGEDPADAVAITQALRDNVSSENVATQYSVPLSEVETIDEAQRIAMVDAYQTQGAVGGAVVLVAALVFSVHRNRPKRA